MTAFALTAKVEFDAAFVRAFNALENPQPAMRAGLLAIGRRVQGVSRASYLSGPRPERLGRVTGNLARGIFVDESGVPFFVDVGSPEIYGPVHEFGATITARSRNRMVWGQGANGGPPFRSGERVVIPARPFLGPAVEDVTPDMANLMGAAIARQMGQGFEADRG